MAELEEIEPTFEPQEVFSIKVFKLEPECVNYSYKVDSKYESHRPELLEQLHMVRGLLTAITEDAQRANIDKWVDQNRNIRIKLLEDRLEEEAALADSGPEGGEPKPN